MSEVAIDPFYKVPVRRTNALDSIVVGDDVVIHLIEMDGGLQLPVMVRGPRSGWHPAQGLQVSLPGARRRDSTLPFFMRVSSLKDQSAPFLAFSDPTYDAVPDATLAWFIGTQSDDPGALVAKIIQHVRSQVGAQLSVVSGSSGGGFLALRIAPLLESAAIVPLNPQTDTFTYSEALTRMVLRAGFDDAREPEARARWADRFSVLASWVTAGATASVRVTYVQNVNDVSHVRRHQRPFVEALQASGGSPFPMRVAFYDGAPGHTSPSVSQWREFLEKAVREWHSRPADTAAVRFPVDTASDAQPAERVRAIVEEERRRSEIEVAPGLTSTVLWRPGVAVGAPVVELAPAVRPESGRRPAATVGSHTGYYHVSDAGLTRLPDLTSTWHIGDKDGDALAGVAVLAQEMRAHHGDVRLVGRGPGGFAAIQVALRIGSGTVVAFSPDIAVEEADGPSTAKFLAATFEQPPYDSDVAARLDAVQALHLFGQGNVRLVLAYDASNRRYVRRQLPRARRLVERMRRGTAVIVPYYTGDGGSSTSRSRRALEERLRRELQSVGVSWALKLAD